LTGWAREYKGNVDTPFRVEVHQRLSDRRRGLKKGDQECSDPGCAYEWHIISKEVKGMSVEVKAPMPGKILEVLVKVGDQVKEDDEVVMLEAMKMENPIYAPVDGTVTEIKVKANDSVETEQVLVVLG
jgi:biotin carboxyl carrier protein